MHLHRAISGWAVYGSGKVADTSGTPDTGKRRVRDTVGFRIRGSVRGELGTSAAADGNTADEKFVVFRIGWRRNIVR